MTMNIIRSYLIIFLLLFLNSNIYAQETKNQTETRTSFTLSTKPVKRLKLSFSPELRFNDSFSLDKYFLEGKASYSFSKYLSFDAGYRLYGNKKENKETDHYNRYELATNFEKWIWRVKSSLKISYTNNSDDDENGNFLRYRAKFKYDIKKCKVTPYLGTELFHSIKASNLHKMRYFAGVDYKLCKKNYLCLNYKFDYFLNEYKNKHITSIGYKLNF